MKNAKKKVMIILVSILGLGGLIFGWRAVAYLIDDNSNKTFLLPQIESAKVKIVSLSSTQSEMKMDLRVKNHLPFPIKGDSLNYKILVDGQKLIGGKHKASIRLAMGDKNYVSLPMTMYKDYFKALAVYKDEQDIDSVVYELDFSFETNLFGRREINFNMSEKLPLFHFPEIETKYRGVDSIHLKKTVINLLVSIENKNIFSIETEEFSYRFTISDYDWIEGKIPGKIVFESKSTTEFEIPVDIPYGELSKVFLELLFKGDDLKYVLELHFSSRSSEYFVDDFQVVLINSNSVKKLFTED